MAFTTRRAGVPDTEAFGPGQECPRELRTLPERGDVACSPYWAHQEPEGTSWLAGWPSAAVAAAASHRMARDCPRVRTNVFLHEADS